MAPETRMHFSNAHGVEADMEGRQRRRRHRDIVFAAAELFAANGFSETTMEDIATKAEVSPPTIYNYFRPSAYGPNSCLRFWAAH